MFTFHIVTLTTRFSARLRRTFDRAVGAEYAAVAGKRFYEFFAVRAFVEKEARVRGHRFGLFEAALWTCQDGFEFCFGYCF